MNKDCVAEAPAPRRERGDLKPSGLGTLGAGDQGLRSFGAWALRAGDLGWVWTPGTRALRTSFRRLVPGSAPPPRMRSRGPLEGTLLDRLQPSLRPDACAQTVVSSRMRADLFTTQTRAAPLGFSDFGDFTRVFYPSSIGPLSVRPSLKEFMVSALRAHLDHQMISRGGVCWSLVRRARKLPLTSVTQRVTAQSREV